MLTLPEICSVDVGDKQIKVLCSKPGTELWIEATDTCLMLLKSTLQSMITGVVEPAAVQ